MEELQDAIEDAQYVNAIATQEDGPRPVLPWDKPTEEQLKSWEESKRPGIHTLDWTLSSPIGFFLFSSYVKEVHDDYRRINFCEEVLRFKRQRGRARVDHAIFVWENYLSLPDTPPQPSEINEHVLERAMPQELMEEELARLYDLNMDYPVCSTTIVGVMSPVLLEILERFKRLNEVVNLGPKYSSMRFTLSKAAANSSILPDAEHPKEASAEVGQIKASSTVDPPSSNLSLSSHDSTSMKPPTAPVASGMTTSTKAASYDDDPSESGVPPPPELGRAVTVDSALSKRAQSLRLLRSQSMSHSSSNQLFAGTLFDSAERVVMESLRRDYWDSFLESEHYKKLKNFLWYQDRPVVPDDFFVMRVLGRGGFGLVTACKKGTSGKLYAMKVMNKRRIKMKGSERLALNERQALAAVESNFVVNLKYSFHSKDDVFLILDLMTGGDLGYHLHQKGRFPKKECQYYAARIMLGLQALHDKQYVYRDLKPENCLLADDGRVKITDLGLATKITPSLHGAAGTRGYWAPEMLRRDKKGRRMPYGHTVDWFSFGCCVAEFISGSNPFRSEAALTFGLERLDRSKQTKEKEKERAIDLATLEMDPEFPPEKFEADAADFCRRLLDKNENTRLGHEGCEVIMCHPWFKNVNWESIISDQKRPPFVPLKDVNAASQSEIGTFAEDRTYQETVITDGDEENYKGWDWTNPHAFAAEVIEFLIYERVTGEPLLPISQNASCCCEIL